MKLKLTLLLIAIGSWAYGQDQGESFTLEECISYGLQNNVNVKNAILDEQIAQARVKETVGIGLPQVSGSVTIQKSPKLQRFFVKYNANSPSNFIPPSAIQQQGIQDKDVVAIQNFLALKSQGVAAMNVDQMIFNGSYIVGLQASNAYKELSYKQANQTSETTVMNISKAFYNVLIAKEQLELVADNLSRLDTLYRNTAAMQQNGFAEQIDVDRLKVNINNLKVNEQAAANSLEVAMYLLKFQMNYPYDAELDLNGSLDDGAVQLIEIPEDGEWDYSSRPDYQVLLANQKLQELNIKNKYAEALPSLGAFATLGMNTQSANVGGIFKTESNFTSSQAYGTDQWYHYSTIGVRLNWNIFTGLQRTYQIQQEKLSLSKIKNSFEMLEKNIDMQIIQSRNNLTNALEALEVQSENLDLASNIYDITKTKYEEGVGSSLEVTDADNSLKQAQTNYYSALYNAIIAQLELKKSLGILYNQQ